MRGLFGLNKNNRQAKKTEKMLQKAKASYEAEDYENAFTLFSQAASLDSPEAQYWLGMCYLNGQGVVLNLRDAALWHETAANGGWEASTYILALLYMRGVPEVEENTGQNIYDSQHPDHSNIQPDLDKARHWAKIAADQGISEAEALYAYLISAGSQDVDVCKEALAWYDKSIAQDSAQGYMGKGLLLLRISKTEEDYTKAAELLEVAASRGMGTAAHKLGVLYETGQGVRRNFTRAAKLYKEAAEAGVRDAQALYGVALRKGQGVEQNFIQAETWLRKAALAGDVEAAVVLADMNGQGNDDIPPNYAEALRWYTLAAENGHITALRALGLLYLRGLGAPQSIEKATELLTLAASKGDIVATLTLGDIAIQIPESNLQLDDVIKEFLMPGAEKKIPAVMFNLAIALLKSNTINPDPEKEKQAREWFRKSCDEIIPARYWYGRMLIQGAGGEQDSENGYAWISSAAHEGIMDAQMLWGSILLEGEANNGTALAEEAVKFYKMAADQGSVPAMFSLGAVYGGGNHLEPNRAKAQEWFIKAAELGHPKAQLMLGRYFSQGLAGEQDLTKARYWFEMALKSGETEAEFDLKQLDNPEAFQNPSSQTDQPFLSKSDLTAESDKEQPKEEKIPGKVEVAPGLFFIKKK